MEPKSIVELFVFEDFGWSNEAISASQNPLLSKQGQGQRLL